MPESVAAPMQKIFNRLSNEPAYAQIFHAFMEEDGNRIFATEIAWQLRGKHKYFDFVDLRLKDDEYAERIKVILPNFGLDVAMQQMIRRPSDRYSIFNALLTRQASLLHDRDKLVAHQLGIYLVRPYPAAIQAILDQKDVCTIAVVQGLLHNIQPLVHARHPGLLIHEGTFGAEQFKDFLQTPYLAMQLKKIELGDKPLPRKMIDYTVFVLLTTAEYIDKGPTPAQTGMAEVFDLLREGSRHSLIVDTIAATKDIPKIENIDAAKLRDTVTQMLQALDA